MSLIQRIVNRYKMAAAPMKPNKVKVGDTLYLDGRYPYKVVGETRLSWVVKRLSTMEGMEGEVVGPQDKVPKNTLRPPGSAPFELSPR